MPSRRLFAQLSFLLLLASFSANAQSLSRTVAITVDDLPFASGALMPLSSADRKLAAAVNRKILRGLAAHRTPAVGFVVGQFAEKLGMSASTNILQQWTNPGFDLGNHLYSHPDVNTLSVGQIEQEITRGETILVSVVSRKPQFLRFPYNHTGDTSEKHDAVATYMSAHGYRLAPCTIDNSDYEFNAAYVLALAQRDRRSAAKIRAEYIAYTAAEIDYYGTLNKQVLGHEPPQIMLLHDSPLNADTINDLLSLFEQRGYTFVTLSDALKDSAYQIPDTYITRFGPMWGYRWARELNVKADGRAEPEPPAWISEYPVHH